MWSEIEALVRDFSEQSRCRVRDDVDYCTSLAKEPVFSGTAELLQCGSPTATMTNLTNV